MKHRKITGKILRCFFEVYNRLGYGFLEKVYEKALLIELRRCGLKCVNQFPISVYYNSIQVGEYYADILVENSVIIELKAGSGIIEEHECQLINYLKATEVEVGLLLSFGPQPQFRRKIFSNDPRQSA